MSGTIGRLRRFAATQLGLDPAKGLAALLRFPRYVLHWSRFRRNYRGPMELMPCLHDADTESAGLDDEYFLQDLYVARLIQAAAPQKHVDVGSRVDGFVAHVASFREIEVFDIRPVSKAIPGIVFRKADLMREQEQFADYADSVSCLHALEHFGLGRYGDPLDAAGFEKGLKALSRLLTPGGILYLSVPVGRERVIFNAHRVVSPQKLRAMCNANGLRLQSLACVTAGELRELPADDLETLETLDYALAIGTFRKENVQR